MPDRIWTLVLNTLLLSGATCAVGISLGTVLAWLLARSDLPGRRIGLVSVGVLLFIPLHVQAAAWQAGFGLQGWYTLACHGPVWLDGWTGVIWVHSLTALPWIVLIVGAGFRLVEPELEEQALLDGSPRQVFLRVTLPRAGVAVGVASLWVVIVTAGEMTATDLFGVRTYAEEVYTRFAVTPDPEEASLAALPGVVLTAGLILAGLAVCARGSPLGRSISLRARPIFRLGRWRGPAAALSGMLLILLVGVPLGSLAYKAGVVVNRVDAHWVRSWSPKKCLTTVGRSPIRHAREFGWSLAIGSLAATTAVALGTGLAWWGQQAAGSRQQAARGGKNGDGRQKLRGGLVLAIAAVCLAVPGPVLGLGTIWLLNRPGWPMLNRLYDHSILAPGLVLVMRGLPLAVLIMWHAQRTIPGEMLDCAALDGAGPLARLWRIALPCRVSALCLAWLVALAVAVADLAATILVVPPGMTTLSIRIFDFLHAGVDDLVAGVCLAEAVLFALLAACAMWMAKRWESQSRVGRRCTGGRTEIVDV